MSRTTKTTKKQAKATTKKSVDRPIPYRPAPEAARVEGEILAPPVEPWNPEQSRLTLELLKILADLHREKVTVHQVRDLVQVSVHHGPAIVCTAEEWFSEELFEQAGKACAALRGNWGPRVNETRALSREDFAELRAAAVDYVVEPAIVAELLGGVSVTDTVDGRKRLLVRAADPDGDQYLYDLEALGDGAVRVRLVGRQFGCLIAPNQQTANEDGSLIPAFDDAEAIAAKKGAA